MSNVEFVCAMLMLGAPGGALAQSESGEEADKSGTNPTVLNRSINISNDFRSLTGSLYFNTTTLKYTEPFADGRMAVRVSLPTSATNIPGADRFGLGDISVKGTWVAYLDRRQGFVVSGEISTPTASNAAFGSGKWVIAPGMTYAYFLTREIIVAPALIHNISFAGDNARARVNRTDFDFYTVYKPGGQSWWLTSDLAVSRDYISRTTPASWKLALGLNIGKIGDGAVNLSLRPGVGIGRDKPFRWSFETGITVVGF